MIVLLGMSLTVVPARADIDEQAGTSGGRFFKVNFGARAMAMGGAYTAEQDVYALQWNPAAGARKTGIQVGAQQTDLLLDMKTQYVGVGNQRVGPVSMSAFGAFFDKGTFDRTTELEGGAFGGFDGTFTASDWQAGINAARSLTDRLDVGMNLKYLRSKIESFEASAWALDGGVGYQISPRYRMGVSVENVGQDLTFVNQDDPLPMTLNGGVSGRWRLSDSFGYQANLDVRKPRDDEVGLHVGNELSMYSHFALRAGYRSSSDLSDGFSVGAGVQLYTVRMDYAYVPSGDFFDRRQNISFTLRF